MPNFYWLTQYRREASNLAGGEAAGGMGTDAVEGGELPRQVRLLEEEEEADEGEVFVDPWGDTQAYGQGGSGAGAGNGRSGAVSLAGLA